MFWLRFLVGGLIIAFIPIMAERLGGKLAGLVVVFPTLITLSFLAIGQAYGPSLVKQASIGALWGVPALVIFLIITYLMALVFKDQSYLLWISGGIISWIIIAYIILKIKQLN